MRKIKKYLSPSGSLPRRRLKFTPEQVALFESSFLNKGMNNSGWKKLKEQGVLALQHLELEKREEEARIRSRSERPYVLTKKASLAKRLRGGGDEYALTTQIVGMSGADPLLSFYVGGVGLNGIGALAKTGLWNVAKYTPTTQLGNWGRGYFVGNAFKNSFNGAVPTLAPLLTSKNLFRTKVYKGGEITDPYSNFVTTDPLYAANYGKITPYIFESKSITKAKEPMMGYRDPVSLDMFIYNNIKRNPNATAIIGHDAVTGEFTPSKGIEILNLNPKNLYPIKTSEPSTSLKFFERKPNKISEIKRLENVKTPIITTENATSMTPEQWTAAQDAAIARGDMAEAQRLRDLHFKVNAPSTQIKDIQYHGAKENAKFNVFDPKLIGQTDQGWAGRGYYFTPSIDYAKMYGSEPRAFYINAQKVHDGTASTYFGREDGPAAKAFKIIRRRHGNDGQQILDDLASSDAIRTSFSQTQPYNGIFEEVVARNNNQMKLADAVTYDDKGVRIPLGERDNFNINDIRYGLLPFGIGLTGYGLYKRKLGGKMNTLLFLKNGSDIHIKKKNRGKFTDYCGGLVTQECINKGKHSSNPAIRKRATFADNARKWKHKEGGKAFVEEVNVLDSNPNAYKYVKKKYKMRMALNGTKFDIGKILNSDLGKAGIGLAKWGVDTILTSKKKSEFSSNFDLETKDRTKAMYSKSWGEKYEEGLRIAPEYFKQNSQEGTHFGEIDFKNFAKNYADSNVSLDLIKEFEAERALLKKELLDAILGTSSTVDAIFNGIGEISNYIGNKKSTINGSPSFTNYSSSYNYFSTPKKFGTFNNDGSMNLGYNMTWSTDKGVQTKNWSDGIFNKSLTDYLK